MDNSPMVLYVAIATGLLAIISTVAAAVSGYFLYQAKHPVDVAKTSGENQHQTLANVDFGNETLNEMATRFKPVILEKTRLEIENGELKAKIELHKMELAREQGARQSALERGDAAVRREATYQQQINDLSNKVDELEKTVNRQTTTVETLKKIMQEHNIEIPAGI